MSCFFLYLRKLFFKNKQMTNTDGSPSVLKFNVSIVAILHYWLMNIVLHRILNEENRISGVMISVLVSSALNRGFEPRTGQTKDFKIGICCFSAKHTALRRKSKDWLARNQDNVSEWGTCLSADCCFSELALWNPTKCVGLVQNGPHHLIENNLI